VDQNGKKAILFDRNFRGCGANGKSRDKIWQDTADAFRQALLKSVSVVC